MTQNDLDSIIQSGVATEAELRYAKTCQLLKEAGLPEQYIGHGTVEYLLNVEKKTPEEVVTICVGRKQPCRECW